MTSSEIRQSFLDFFKSKPREHTIVRSSPLDYKSRDGARIFTNAGMNQFVPIFLGEEKPEVNKWADCIPGLPTRAADTQKCIRATGKHNDLDDVGLDTYHHTFFEMLGNWSFGDYFKKEAIEWAWELLTKVWGFPKERLYVTVYKPENTTDPKVFIEPGYTFTFSAGEKDKPEFPFGFDVGAFDYWAEILNREGLDPKAHIVFGGKKDNFWMMGDTGPCGPCSEIHVDLTPNGDTKGALVNKGDARCIEIWNLVFIQFNANPGGGMGILPACHVDTGMGFERVTGIIQNTKNFTDFSKTISNYETDIFRPLFDKLEKLSGKKYQSTLPSNPQGSTGDSPVPVGDPPTGTSKTLQTAKGATYSKRNLPHFEKPWAIYHVIINTITARKLSPAARDMVFDCILHWRDSRYRLVAACVMPDHAHFIIQPGVKEEDKEGNPVFWPLSEILHSIKSYSAKEINKLDNVKGTLWQEERYDRYMRSDLDLQEKFHYVCRNPWAADLVKESEPWPWLWTPDIEAWKPYVPLSKRKGSTGDSPTGSERTSNLQSVAGLQSNAPSHSARQVAERHGQVARATQMDADHTQIQMDIAFRVIADHIRTLSFAIADGIQPGNTDRNYVLRRILRRAVRYGRTLGFHEPFFYKLVDVLAEKMGHVFPEIREKQKHVQDVIRTEEEAFNKTLDSGIKMFDGFLEARREALGKVQRLETLISKSQQETDKYNSSVGGKLPLNRKVLKEIDDALKSYNLNVTGSLVRSLGASSLKDSQNNQLRQLPELHVSYRVVDLLSAVSELIESKAADQDALRMLETISSLFQASTAAIQSLHAAKNIFAGSAAFLLYDTYGFPLDLTELMARERGLTVDVEGFNKLMEEQRARARAAQKKEVISLSQIETTAPTKFVGYDKLQTSAKVLEVVGVKDKTAVVLDTSTAYAEMGGQVGDTGELSHGGQLWRVINTQKNGNVWLHFIADKDAPPVNTQVEFAVDRARRDAIQRHHTVTHLLHWALHEVVSKEASQKGSFVGPDKLTFDFNSAPLTRQQVADIEKLVNERILENAGVSWTEVPYADVKSRKDVMQFFGDKYGDVVRVVQIGGHAAKLDGYSMELCGGTHTRATGEIGLFRIVGENAIAAGVRRIEAVAGLQAYEKTKHEAELIGSVAGKVNSPIGELEKKIESLLAHQKELEKQLKATQQKQAAELGKSLVAKAFVVAANGSSPVTEKSAAVSQPPLRAIIVNLGAVDGDFLQAVADSLKGEFKGVVVLGGTANNSVSLVATVSPELTAKVQAGKIIQAIAPIVGGKGGGKPDNARGGGKDISKLDEALAKAKSLLG